MTTAIQGVYNGYSIANLAQVKAYTEGAATLALNPLTLTTSTNYSRVYTLTLTIVSANYANLNIVQSNTSGPLLVKSGAVYTISSEYIDSKGVKINNWAFFKLAIQGLTLQFKNTDWGETFDIQSMFSDGAVSSSGTIQVVTTAVPDVTGNNQTVTVGMAMNGQSLTTVGGTNIAIADANQAGKTYRVTFTPQNATNASGTSDIKTSLSGTWTTPLILTGTQASINAQIASSGNGNGLNFNQYNMNFYGTTSVSYLQEVLTTTEPGVTVPYTQETGNIIFNTTYTAPFAIGSNPTYSEDSSVTFSLGSITDPAGTNYSHETCGLYQGYNCYTVTATVAGSFSGSNPVVLTYAGDVSLNNSITFTGSKTACNSFLSSVTLIPPADYTNDLVIDITITRGNTPVTIYTGSMTATCSSAHSEFSIIGGAPFAIGNNTINFGSITDAATSKNYTVTIDGLQSSTNYGTLTDLSGVGTWSNTGGVGGFGRLTITGTKAVLNTSLSAIRYTTGTLSALGDNMGFTYTQTQTTNSLSQGVATIQLNNAFQWGTGNYSGSYVFDENTKMTYNLGVINTTITGTAKAEITLGTAFSTANGGSITGWTKVSDTVWTFSGTKAAVNAALASTEFITPADRRTNFTVDMKIYDDATVKYSSVSFSATKTFTIRTTYPYISATTPLQLSIGGDSAIFNIGSVVDVRSTNVSTAITYSIVLTPSSLTQITSMSSAGTGGTTSWSGTALTITGTKTQVNSHLSTVTINYLGSADSTITWAQTQTTNSTTQGPATITVLKTIPQYMFLSFGSSARTNDLTTWDIDTLPNGSGLSTKTATFINSKWVVINPNSLSGSTANINKSTATSWVASTMTAGITQVLYDDITYAGTAAGANTRVTAWYDGPAGGGSNHLGVSYTTNDTTYTTFQLTETPGIGINNAGSVSFLNNRFHIPFISRSYYLRMATSTNGSTWTYQDLATGTTSSCIIGKEMTFNSAKFGLPITMNNSLQLYFSDDGISWAAGTVSSTARNTTAAIYNGSYWIVFGYSTSDSILKAYKSTNGSTWTSTSLAVTADNDSLSPRLAYGNSTWVVKNAAKIYQSTDGIIWTERSFGFTPYSVYTIKFMNNKFYALVSQTNNNSKLMESTDGITWSVRYSFPTGENWTEMVYSG